MHNTMEASTFTDYYEVLEISPNANSETIERVFRYLAQRYHPDNPETSNRPRFDGIVEAHNTLRDPVKRVQYDIQHKHHSRSRRNLLDEVGHTRGIERDIDVQNKVLSIFYVKRRQNTNDPGMRQRVVLIAPPSRTNSKCATQPGAQARSGYSV